MLHMFSDNPRLDLVHVKDILPPIHTPETEVSVLHQSARFVLWSFQLHWPRGCGFVSPRESLRVELVSK